MTRDEDRGGPGFVWKRTTPLWTALAALPLLGMAAALVFPLFGLPEAAMFIALVGLSALPAVPELLRERLLGAWGIRTAWGRAGTITVGGEGVALRGRWRTRVVPYARIAGVRAQGLDRVRLELVDGAEIVLGCEEPDALEGAIVRAWIASQKGSYREPARLRVDLGEVAEPVLCEEIEEAKGAWR